MLRRSSASNEAEVRPGIECQAESEEIGGMEAGGVTRRSTVGGERSDVGC